MPRNQTTRKTLLPVPVFYQILLAETKNPRSRNKTKKLNIMLCNQNLIRFYVWKTLKLMNEKWKTKWFFYQPDFFFLSSCMHENLYLFSMVTYRPIHTKADKHDDNEWCVWVHVLVLILSLNLFSSSSLSLLSTTESFFQETKTNNKQTKLVIDKNPMNSIQKIRIKHLTQSP